MITPEATLERLAKARHAAPHDDLGLHPVTVKRKKGLRATAYLRDVTSVQLIDLRSEPERRFDLTRVTEDGFFEAFLPGEKEPFTYRLRVDTPNGEIRQFHDPYAFLPTLSDQDLYLFNEGNEHWIHQKLGSHLREIDGVPGVAFAVWAPSAKRVSVVGDFNHWDGRYHPMRSLGSSGVWELFIPGLVEGSKYKFEILGGDGYLHLKTDPFGTAFEAPPHNASIVCKVDRVYHWQDADWLEKRGQIEWRSAPLSILEVHLQSWKRNWNEGGRPFTYREMAGELVAYCNRLGYTHVEFLPLAEHPFAASWGYQVTGFFAPTQRFGSPQDFMFLVDSLHQAGIGVIMDWVPGHFPKDAFALARFDGTCLYEHADPRQGEHMDWGTLIFNYGRHEVRCFLVASALAWLDRYHIDGLRVDAVASMLYLDYSRREGEWVPNQYGGRENIEAIQFLRQTNELVHRYFPGSLTIAEESTAFGGVTHPPSVGGLGFDFKWNMGWMNDTLEYFKKDPLYRRWHQNNLTFGMIYQYSEAFVNVFSHDEVVHGKGSMILKMAAENMTAKAGTLRALYAFMWTWPGKNTLFMGCDFGQSLEWRYDEGLQWDLLQYQDHEGVQLIVRDLNHLYRNEPAFHATDCDPAGFRWLALDDAESSVIAFQRTAPDGTTFVVVGHYTPLKRDTYRIGVPHPGYWREVLNSDASVYGGTGAGNLGGLHAEDTPTDGLPFSLNLTLPGNSTLIFKWEGSGE